MSNSLPGKFLTAEWRYLLMLNYEINPAVLTPYVPKGTEIDFWDGRTFISLVGFMFLNTKVLGIPIPFHRNFEEVNLRFYVRYKGPEGWRRGVAFIKEIVPRFAIAAVARGVYNENYVSLPMRHTLEREGDIFPTNGGTVEYGWRFQDQWHSMKAIASGPPSPLQAGSEAEFITEHYWGYAAQVDGGCVEYRVEHPPWQVWSVREWNLVCDAVALYGLEFGQVLTQPPSSAFLAAGSDVTVRKGIRLY
jgi:uncharacterized protein YqjF (DUF2071 family)